MKFLKIGMVVLIIIILSVCLWVYPFKLPNKNDFILEVKYKKDCFLGETTEFLCSFKNNTHKLLKLEHAANIISYAVDGKKENMISKAVTEYFSPYQSNERIIEYTFEEKGEYVITFFAEIKILKGEKKASVLLEEEVTVIVR